MLRNVDQDLGSLDQRYLRESIIVMHESGSEKNYTLQVLLLINCYLNLCPVTNTLISFDVFMVEVMRKLAKLDSLFELTDQNAFKQLVESFHKVATKVEQDQTSTNLEIWPLSPQNQSDDVSLDLQKKMIESHSSGDITNQIEDKSSLVDNYGTFSGFIPGLNFIRQQVIKPLLFATEKVVEQYIVKDSDAQHARFILPYDSPHKHTSNSHQTSPTLHSKMASLSLETTPQQDASLKKRTYR